MSVGMPQTNQSKSLRDLLGQLTKEIERVRAMSEREPMHGGACAKVAQDLYLHPGATRQEVTRRTHLPPRQATMAMTDLVNRGMAVRLGERRGARWWLATTIEAMAKVEH